MYGHLSNIFIYFGSFGIHENWKLNTNNKNILTNLLLEYLKTDQIDIYDVDYRIYYYEKEINIVRIEFIDKGWKWHK